MLLFVLGILLGAIGLFLDGCSVLWAYQTARTGIEKSGFAIVPFVFYLVGILLISWGDLAKIIVAAIIAGIFHLFCWQLIPAIFDRCIGRR